LFALALLLNNEERIDKLVAQIEELKPKEPGFISNWVIPTITYPIAQAINFSKIAFACYIGTDLANGGQKVMLFKDYAVFLKDKAIQKLSGR
jgi:hypothetical protein